ncbi:Small ribosomal subunit protein uS17c [Plasmodiophora brassicae]|nr:hypothetical protein PBRA_006153 [Plasmodiophora brassicae]
MSTTFVGRVLNTKMTKTVVVLVNRFTTHPLYNKRMRKTKKFMAHDEDEAAGVGDLVLIRTSRPYSKRKKFILKEILKRSPQFLYEQSLKDAAATAAAADAAAAGTERSTAAATGES